MNTEKIAMSSVCNVSKVIVYSFDFLIFANKIFESMITNAVRTANVNKCKSRCKTKIIIQYYLNLHIQFLNWFIIEYMTKLNVLIAKIQSFKHFFKVYFSNELENLK